MYFARKAHVPTPLPKFEETKGKLPSPVFDEDPACVQMYWKAWELAFRNFYEPPPGSPFVSQFIDAAFNQNIFLWDTCFMTMFCNYGYPYVPGIGSLDNFYARQFEDGEICREINRSTGKEFHDWVNHEGGGLHSSWGLLDTGGRHPFTVSYVGRQPPQPPPHLTLDALNHPIFAWAELESFRITGDRSRLGMVYEPLTRYYRALQQYIRQGNGLYMTDWASMDNSPRNPYLAGGGTAVDTSSQMVLFARGLAQIATLLGKPDSAAGFRAEAEELSRLINDKMWSPERKFYFDLTVEGKQSPVKTAAAFWTLLAGVAGPQQVEALAVELRNPKTFARQHPVPTVSADEPGYDPAGGYWKGAVWPPVNTMVVRGLENCGQRELAEQIALEHLRVITRVFKDTGTVWENYAPDAAKPGKPAKPDLVGWSGLGPILYLIEYGIGVHVDAPSKTIVWNIRSPDTVGVERLGFCGSTVSLTCSAPDAQRRRTIRAKGGAPFHLKVTFHGATHRFDVRPGELLVLSLDVPTARQK
jgi:glycogen debranching enzyme